MGEKSVAKAQTLYSYSCELTPPDSAYFNYLPPMDQCSSHHQENELKLDHLLVICPESSR